MVVALPGPFWLIGCGNMAGAMLDGWLAAGMNPAQVTVIRPSGAPVADGVRVLTALPEDEVPAMAMLGVKPQKLDEVAPLLAPALGEETILLSILAGARGAALRDRFATPRTIVRAMPNLPVRLGKGVIGLHSEDADEGDLRAAEALMRPLGLVEWFADEALFDAGTVLSGCGPAFFYRFIDALAAAATARGLPEEQALRMAKATAEGASALAAGADVPPATLADRVASPGGVTRAGLDMLDEKAGLDALVARTFEAAMRRSREMADEAGSGPS